MLIAGLGAAPAASASTHHRAVLTYVALGDSYATGQATDCSHPATSYPRVLDRLHRIKLLRDAACAGATTKDVRTTQLAAVRRGVKLVTITVGANDLALTTLTAACSRDPKSDACITAIGTAAAALPTLSRHLVKTYLAVAAKAPRARILVTGYAPLLSSGPIHDATERLNGTIAWAVRAAAGHCTHVRFVPVEFGPMHTLDGPLPWFEAAGPNAFHPNAAGEAAYARAIRTALF
jgi:lysophospholipase L1-like esterase